MCYVVCTWWRHQMETFSALLAMCAGNSPVSGEFPAQRPVTRSFDVFFDLPLNKRLSKQSWGWWFKTPSCPLRRHCNDIDVLLMGEGKACGGLPFLGTGCPVPDVGNIYLIWNDWYMGYCSCTYLPPSLGCKKNNKKNGLDNLPWTSSTSGGRLNKKDGLTRYGDSHVKDKTS